MTQQSIDEMYMSRCIQIASNGLGITYPNPFVGSVIVHNNVIIGEGFTSEYGGPHAEVNAINSVKNKELLKDSTLYVTLEPCSHFGKTPPCANLIIEKEIPKVVIGTLDPFAKVNGQGYLRLLKNGIDVRLGVLEKQCLALNKRFITFHEKKRPYIILKWAQTEDGYMGRDDIQKWITNKYSKQLVHKWRTEEQAILVGKNTALIDNPKLDARLWTGNNPVRIAIDKNLAIPQSFNLYNKQQETIIFNAIESSEQENLKLVQLDFSMETIPQILKYLYEANIQSIIIEGGSATIQRFINLDLWDEARILSSDTIWNEGILAPRVKGTRVEKHHFSSTDKLTIFENRIETEES